MTTQILDVTESYQSLVLAADSAVWVTEQPNIRFATGAISPDTSGISSLLLESLTKKLFMKSGATLWYKVDKGEGTLNLDDQIVSVSQGAVPPVSQTQQQTYDSSPTGLITTAVGKPWGLEGTNSGLVFNIMTDLEYDALSLTLSETAFTTDDNRLSIWDGSVKQKIAYLGDVQASDTLQELYTVSPTADITLTVGKPWRFISAVAGFAPPVMTDAQFDAIALSQSELAFTTDDSRISIWDGVVKQKIAYLGDIQASDTLQELYTVSPTADIPLTVGKPWKFSSTVAAFAPPVMTDAEFKVIPLPDTALFAYDPGVDRYIANNGTPIAPNYENIAWLSDIEAIEEDVVYGEMFFQDNVTETVIAVAGTPVKINATYTSGELQEFSQAGGTLTYNGPITRVMKITASLTASLNLSTAEVSIYIYKNGLLIAKSKQGPDLDGISPSFKSISVSLLESISQTDTIEAFVANESTTDNITAKDLNLTAHTIGGTAGGTGQFLEVAANFSDVANRNIATRNIGITAGIESITDELDRVFTTANQPSFIRAVYTTPGHIIRLCPFDQTDSPGLGYDFCSISNEGTEAVQIQNSTGAFLGTFNPQSSLTARATNNTPGGDIFLYPITFTVNGQSGFVGLTAADINGNYSPVNYIPTSANLDGYLEGIDDALTGGSPVSLQIAYNTGNEIDQTGGPRTIFRSNTDPFIDIIADADGSLVRSGLSLWSENSVGTSINGGNIRNWLPGNTPGSEYSFMEFQVFDQVAAAPKTAMYISGDQASHPGLILEGAFPLQAAGRGGFGVSVGAGNEIDQSVQFEVRSPFNNTASKPWPILTDANYVAIAGKAKASIAYISDIDRLTINVGTSGAQAPRVIAYTSDIPTARPVKVLANTQTPVVTYPTDAWTSMLGTLNGSNTIPANTLLVGQTVEIDITGIYENTLNGSNSNMRVLFSGSVLSTSANINVTGFSGVREWALKYKVTATSALTMTASASGWYGDSAGNVKTFDMVITPVSLAYNGTIANSIDVQYNPSSIGGGTEFIANNLNIIQYT